MNDTSSIADDSARAAREWLEQRAKWNKQPVAGVYDHSSKDCRHCVATQQLFARAYKSQAPYRCTGCGRLENEPKLSEPEQSDSVESSSIPKPTSAESVSLPAPPADVGAPLMVESLVDCVGKLTKGRLYAVTDSCDHASLGLRYTVKDDRGISQSFGARYFKASNERVPSEFWQSVSELAAMRTAIPTERRDLSRSRGDGETVEPKPATSPVSVDPVERAMVEDGIVAKAEEQQAPVIDVTDSEQDLYGDTDRIKTICQRAHAVYGDEHNERRLIEEMGELTVALSHLARGKVGAADVITEIADVALCLYMLALRFDENAVKAELLRKALRMEERCKTHVRQPSRLELEAKVAKLEADCARWEARVKKVEARNDNAARELRGVA